MNEEAPIRKYNYLLGTLTIGRPRKARRCDWCKDDVEAGNIYYGRMLMNGKTHKRFLLRYHPKCFNTWIFDRLEKRELHRYDNVGRKPVDLPPDMKRRRLTLLKLLSQDIMDYNSAVSMEGKIRRLELMTVRCEELEEFQITYPIPFNKLLLPEELIDRLTGGDSGLNLPVFRKYILDYHLDQGLVGVRWLVGQGVQY